jgi:tetratricopeptide (TPR) repeat protein
MDEQDPEPGFSGMHGAGGAQMPPGFFLGWTPGRLPLRGREDLSWRLSPNADLVVMLHLRPTERPESVRARVGLYFAGRAPTLSPTTLRLGTESIDIPPGERNYVVRDSFVLPVEVQALGVYPHAHYLAKRIRGRARLPGGDRVWLIDIPRWDFNWQDEYRYAAPVRLPPGTVLEMELVYDNSDRNARNPSHPPRRVVFGPNSTDEMGDLWISVLPRDSADLALLHRDLAIRGLQRRIAGLETAVRLRPEDASARHHLGNLLQASGRVGEAVEHYLAALRIRPDDAGVHYNLALALQRLGRLEESIVHYRLAIMHEPAHVDAMNNLGNLLLTLGDTRAAVAQYRQALELAPAHADAHNNLGLALISDGRAREGARHLNEAIRLRPDWATPRAALAWTLATHPEAEIRDSVEALRLAETAVALTSRGDLNALNALAAAYAAAGRFAEATAVAEEAAALAMRVGASEAHRQLLSVAELYRQGRPHRAPPGWPVRP